MHVDLAIVTWGHFVNKDSSSKWVCKNISHILCKKRKKCMLSCLFIICKGSTLFPTSHTYILNQQLGNGVNKDSPPQCV